ncbi:MAG: NUDIX hydrolase [Bacteroidales bacterium]|jgi:ADP-ribose pyrophosphatase YjhB (NUDIX family)
MSFKWLDIAKELQSIAQAGLEYTTNPYDVERYMQLRELSVKIIHEYSHVPMQKIYELFASEKGYQTPKVDIRGVVFRKEKILMVKEKIDGNWSLPGGWADVGFSPFETAAKEIREEAGIIVEPAKLLAVFDKTKHNHPPDAYHVYKLFIECKDTGGAVKPGIETSDAGWFGRDEIPLLSEPRITIEQIRIMFNFYDHPGQPVLCD